MMIKNINDYDKIVSIGTCAILLVLITAFFVDCHSMAVEARADEQKVLEFKEKCRSLGGITVFHDSYICYKRSEIIGAKIYYKDAEFVGP